MILTKKAVPPASVPPRRWRDTGAAAAGRDDAGDDGGGAADAATGLSLRANGMHIAALEAEGAGRRQHVRVVTDLQGLAPVKEHVTVLGGLNNYGGRSWRWRRASHAESVSVAVGRPGQNGEADVSLATTVDQFAARTLGKGHASRVARDLADPRIVSLAGFACRPESTRRRDLERLEKRVLAGASAPRTGPRQWPRLTSASPILARGAHSHAD